MEATAAYVTLTFSFEKEGEDWVGVCLELGTSTFADTFERCQSELEELVTDHLEVLEEIGERECFFDEWGIRIHADEVPPSMSAPRSENVMVSCLPGEVRK